MPHFCVQPLRKEQRRTSCNTFGDCHFAVESYYDVGQCYTCLGTSWVKSYFPKQNNFILEADSVDGWCGCWLSSTTSLRMITTFHGSVITITLRDSDPSLRDSDPSHLRLPKGSTGITVPQSLSFPREVMAWDSLEYEKPVTETWFSQGQGRRWRKQASRRQVKRTLWREEGKHSRIL